MSKILVGGIYRHTGNKLDYRADGLALDASGYEDSEKPQEVVLYTQVQQGAYPAGTKWVRLVPSFLDNFELVRA